ncbi:MAG TPA: recombinase family protein [Actinomycetes bacterium]|nr:recombinase family protein [Actinomycetes bacterium]
MLVEESRHRQEGSIFEHVQRNGLGVIVGVYSEIVSAYDPRAKRTEYENAIDDLRAGRIDGLIVWKLDRLTRRRSEKRRILNVLEECGGRLYSIVEGLDTADPTKREITEIALAIYIGNAEAESEAIGERVSLMHLDRARKGLVQPSSVRPFGHSDDWRALVPAEVKVLHEAAERLFAGEASFSIAADFTVREIPKPSGKTHWNSNVLRRMLLSPRMVGKREYGGTLYELEGVPPIFDEETWEKLCAVLAKRGARSGPVETHLLSSIALCGVCNRTMASSISGRKSVKTYVCRPRFEGDQACRKISVSTSHAEQRVSELVIAFLADKERVSKLLLRSADPEQVAKIQTREAELTTALNDLDKARFAPPPGVPRMSDERYYELVATIEAERQELHRRLVVTREASILNEVLQFEDAAHEWETRSLHWRRTVLKLVTKSIVIEPRGKLLAKDDPRYRPGFNAFDPERVRITFADEA